MDLESTHQLFNVVSAVVMAVTTVVGGNFAFHNVPKPADGRGGTPPLKLAQFVVAYLMLAVIAGFVLIVVYTDLEMRWGWFWGTWFAAGGALQLVVAHARIKERSKPGGDGSSDGPSGAEPEEPDKDVRGS